MSFNKLLLKILASVLFLIFSLTAYLILSKKAEPGKNLAKKTEIINQNQTIFTPVPTVKKNTFTSLGQIRTASKPDKNGKKTVIVVNAYLEYADNDADFYEELDKNTLKIRNLVSQYFSSFTLEELNSKGEDKINAELLKTINSVLVLQKIQKIYFVDYLFL